MAGAGTAYIDFEPRFGNLNAEVAARMKTVSTSMQSRVSEGLTPNKSTLRRVGSNITSNMAAFGKKAGKAMAIGLAGAAVGIGIGLKGAINEASDLEEAVSKVNVVFGSNATEIHKWAKDAAKNLGMSTQAATEAAGTFGNFLISMGNAPDEATKMSKSMVDLSADLASFNNANPEDVLLALRSGLSGEAEPLRKFGVSLSAARVEAEGMASGINKSYNEMTAAEKSQLSYQVIMKDTALAQGDFERTSDGLANQQRIASAQWKDLQARIGKGVLPAVTAFMRFLTDKGIPAIEDVVGGIQALVGAFQNAEDGVTSSGFAGKMEEIGIALRQAWDKIYEVIEPVIAAIVGFFQKNPDAFFGGLAAIIGGALVTAIVGLGVALWGALSPVVLIIGAIALLAGAAIYAYQNFEWFRDAVNAIWPVIVEVVTRYVGYLKFQFEIVKFYVTKVLVPVFKAVWAVIQWVWPAVVAIVKGAWAGIKAVFEAVKGFIVDTLVPAFGEIWQGMQAAWNVVTAVAVWAWQSVIQPVWDAIVSFIQNILVPAAGLIWKAMQAAWNLITAVVVWAWQNVIQPTWNLLIGFIANILVPAFGRIWTTMQTVWDAVIAVVTFAWNTVILPLWTGIKFFIDTVLLPVISKIWFTMQAVWNAVTTVVVLAWQLIKPIWDAIKLFIDLVLIPVFNRILTTMQTVWNGIWAAISFVWNTLIQPLWAAIKFYIDTVLVPVFNTIKSTIETVWNGVWAAISYVWETFIKPLWNGIITFIDETFLPAFTKIKDTISGIWDSIKSTASRVWGQIIDVIRGAINGAIKVINKIIDGVNLVVGIVPGVDKLDHIPEVGADVGKPSQGRRAPRAYAMAAGGVVPYDLGRYGPMVTDGPRAIVGEGNQRHPEYVIPTDPKFRDRALAFTLSAARELGIPMHAAGTRGLQEPFKSNVEAVLAASGGRVGITSGFRSRAEQARLYQKYLNGTGNLAAPPGSSMHERGLAVDYNGPRSVYQALATLHSQKFPVRGEPWHAVPDDGSGGIIGAIGDAIGGVFKGAVRAAIAAPMAAADALIDQVPVKFVRDYAKYAKSKVYDWLISEDDKLPDAAEGGGGTSSIALKALASGTAVQMGQTMAAARGWTGAEWSALHQLWTKESGWNPRADNPSSSAYGIPQSLPGSKMASHGADWRTNPATQIAWGLDYIAGRYGRPSVAWAHSQRHNWYAKGGILPASIHANSFDSGGVLAPGWNIVRNDTGADELVRPQNGAGGPLVNIESAQFNDPVDVDVLDQKLGMLVAMGAA